MLPSIVQQHYIKRAYNRFTPILKNKKTTSYFTITLSLLSLSFFGLFAIRPTLITAVSLIKSVSELKNLNIDYENKIGSIVKAQSEYEQIRDNLPYLQSALPSNALFHKLGKALEIFADRSNISLNQLQIDSVPVSNLPPSDKVQKYGFSLVAKGSYPNIASYLLHLVNWKRIVTIDSLDFAQDVSTSSGNLRITIKGNTYYEP